MDSPPPRHTCLRLRIADADAAAAVVFIKGTWFALRFDLSITDGYDAWTCNATEAEVRQRAAQWDQPVAEYMAVTERYLGFQQPGSLYKFEDAGNGQRRLSWSSEKQGTRLEWRWKCQLCPNRKQTTVGILDFLMDTNMRLSMANEKVNASVPLSAVKSPDLKVRQRLKSDRVKAIWDDKKHAVFVRICLDQMRAGNKPHKTLNKLGYMNLEREFYKQTGFYYFKDQLKNHWDSTRRDWQAWTALRNQAGVGWDDANGTYSQTEDWWASFAKRFPGGDKFAHHPLDHAEELDLLFGEGSGRSDGIAQSPPSSDATPSAATRDSQSDPAPESHGEAEEPDGLIVVRQNSARVEESGETAGRPEKRPRPSDGTKWEACMKQVCDILLGGSKLLASSPADDPASIANAMALLNGTYGVERNSEEWLFAVSKLRNESVRQLFLALGDAESRAAWIKREYRLAHG